LANASTGNITPETVGRALRGRIAGDILTDRFSRAAYATAACIYRIMPLAVVVPKNAADVVAVVKAAGDLGVPVIPRGAGSGLCGQALGRGIILDFTKFMNRILEVDGPGRFVRVQPGAVTGRVNEALAACGRTPGPDFAARTRGAGREHQGAGHDRSGTARPERGYGHPRRSGHQKDRPVHDGKPPRARTALCR